MKWQPDEKLTATLKACGVDVDILESIATGSLDFLTSRNDLDITREFTDAVISQHISWCNTVSEPLIDDSNFSIGPKSIIKKAGVRKKKHFF